MKASEKNNALYTGKRGYRSQLISHQGKKKGQKYGGKNLNYTEEKKKERREGGREKEEGELGFFFNENLKLKEK